MPLLASSFSPPFYLRHSAVQTITPSLFRRPPHLAGESERLELADGDFLDLHWHNHESPTLVILTHGLEGSMESGYLLGLAHALSRAGLGVLRWNMRGCGTERNRLMTWYHSGQSEDLGHVISHALRTYSGEIALVGFSIGGNITLKYLGERALDISPRIRAAVAISVPLDLKGSAQELAKPKNAIYMQHLLRPLRARMLEKAARFPGHFNITELNAIRSFHDFDSRFTAPLHGFSSVDEYWGRASSRQFVSAIRIPTLLVTAKDDPFLSPECIPDEGTGLKENIFVETPAHGGHVGFINCLSLTETWLDRRAVRFISTFCAPGCTV